MGKRSLDRRRAHASAACVALACVAGQPVGCAPAESGEITDGGGCNGGRSLPGAQDDSTTDAETTSDTGESTATEGRCGDGVIDAGEACDDGNAADDDACPSGAAGRCAAAATCGDGLLWTDNEACDDGNDVAGDGCEADCTATPAAQCGNGVVEPGEACDDGDTDETDECPSGPTGKCTATASCGDGFVHAEAEACDDGNTAETDECPSGPGGACAATASCGDGFVHAEVEACDDGNEADDDACPSGPQGQCAAPASCGDGLLWTGEETCDDGNADDTDACNDDCAPPRWVFITSSFKNGNLGGIAGADGQCQSLAAAAGLDGAYMAWLTGGDASAAPATRFQSAQFTGWYRLPTEPPTLVARGWQDLAGPNDGAPDVFLQHAIVADEAGDDVVDASAWTNTSPGGAPQGDDHCNDWSTQSSAASGQTGLSKADTLGADWTVDKALPCNLGLRLYCFQVG